MDIISFNEASTANERIQRINANPDSDSGVVTVPKTIASGETITIPAGRVAVLPNVTVDGDLVIEAGGEVFVPAGAGFSDIAQKVDAVKNYVDKSIPKGVILLWSGSIASIPTGWALCNGQNGTPDLIDRFVVGAGSTYAVGAIGGSKDAVVVEHSHSGTTSSIGAHSHIQRLNGIYGNSIGGYMSGSANGTTVTDSLVSTSSAGATSASITTNSTGESGVDKNLPPYYALAYIMKT